jgi:hypothetical protein
MRIINPVLFAERALYRLGSVAAHRFNLRICSGKMAPTLGLEPRTLRLWHQILDLN